jgi:aldose 1-epimerase
MIDARKWGEFSDGREVNLFTLTGSDGFQVQITNYGGIITSILAPDRDKIPGEVTLGYDEFESYTDEIPYFGCITGRVANRIGKAEFTLNGKTHKLAANNGNNHLHGGVKGFDKVLWDARVEGETLELTYLSPDGDEGYPGNLETTVTYSIEEGTGLRIEYKAVTDADTPVNLTNHTYFNLAGSGNVLDHRLEIPGSQVTFADAESIANGDILPVEGTPMDFQKATRIGERIGADYQLLNWALGYDCNWILDKNMGEYGLAAFVKDEASGRLMEVLTTQPGILFYSGNYLDETIASRTGGQLEKHSGFCLETQHYPNSPNTPSFPSVILRPGEVYNHTTLFRFKCCKCGG